MSPKPGQTLANLLPFLGDPNIAHVMLTREQTLALIADARAERSPVALQDMLPEGYWCDKFYAALDALWAAVKGTERPAMADSPHAVMSALIADVASSLDAAWAEAEAIATPGVLWLQCTGDRRYRAICANDEEWGDTPGDALRALAASRRGEA